MAVTRCGEAGLTTASAVDPLFDIGDARPGDAAAAIIVVDHERYLLQQRSMKSGIYFPGYWGLFGGAAEVGETFEDALKREIAEELAYAVDSVSYFTDMTFDFSYMGCGRITRRFYVIEMTRQDFLACRLGEGSNLDTFSPGEMFRKIDIVPYDAFAIWMHATRQKP
jgi:8-oxo-dGTP pyrophosphatase MutT (NUDIX family)